MMPEWLARARHALWDDASFLTNYHLRARLPRVVCAVEAAHVPLALRAPARALEVRGEHGDAYTLATSFSEPRLGLFFERRLLGRHPVERATRAADADVEAYEVPAYQRTAWARRGFFVLPLWVRQVIDLRPGTDPFRRSRHVRHRIKTIRRRGYDYELTRDRAALGEFYERMYAPTMTARHGAEAYLRSRRYIEHGLAHGQLLFVRRSGRRVAGVLNVFSALDRRQVTTWAGGLLDGDLGLLRQDADSACIYFSVRWAHEQVGCRRISLSVARPFLDDGLLSYRKHWGAHLEPESAWAGNVVALRFNRWAPAIRAALAANPFVVSSGSGLAGVAWLSDSERERSHELDSPGLSSLTLVTERDRAPRATQSSQSLLELVPGREVEQLRALARALGAATHGRSVA